MAKPKVTVVGAGFVGATAAQRIVEQELADVVLYDIVEDMPQGKALDMMESAPVEGFDCKITGTNNMKDAAGSEIVVVTAGLARKPGMSRDDLVNKNTEIVGGVVDKIIEYCPNSMIIMVSNPLDAMCYVAFKKTKWPRNRVFGMAGVLDSARFRSFIAMELNTSMKDVDAMVLGGHGDTMVPLYSCATVSGVPARDLIPKERFDQLVDRTRNGGAEIVKLLKTGSAYYAPSSSVVAMVKSVLMDEKRLLPSCCWCQGEYGLKDVFVGVPAVLGKGGVEKIVELKITPEEKAALNKSADAVRELCAVTKM